MSAALRELLERAPVLLAEAERLRAGIVQRGDDMIVPAALLDEINATGAAWKSRAEIAEAALLAKSAAYEALVAEIARAPVGKVEVYDTPEQWRYVIVPDHFDSGQRVRLLVSDDRPSHTAGDGNG